ncbi:MAG: hypothetical protein ACI8PZ_002819 [Myxococcota bacterium]
MRELPPDGLDVEDRRRWRSRKRRKVRRQGRRRRWLESIRAIEPETAESIEALRRHNPHEFRKALVTVAKRLDLFDEVNRFVTRDLEPLAVRRAKWEAGEDG